MKLHYIILYHNVSYYIFKSSCIISNDNAFRKLTDELFITK